MGTAATLTTPAFVPVPRTPCESCGRIRESVITDRELEVLALVASDYQDKEVAAVLGLEWRTIRSHMTHIRDKIGARTRLGAAMVALEAGWLRPVEGPELTNRHTHAYTLRAVKRGNRCTVRDRGVPAGSHKPSPSWCDSRSRYQN